MDSPLTAAEISRLRKAINQRDRFLSQGLSVVTAESNISRALSNLNLYDSQSQFQLGAVLKDWEGADQVKKAQIVAWLKQNVLKEQVPPAEQPNPPLLAQESIFKPTFVAPPPPPPLPTKANSFPIQSQPQPQTAPYQYVFNAVPYADTTASKAPSEVSTLPSPPSIKHTNSLGPLQLREMHTQAYRKAPPPPPKDTNHSRTASAIRTDFYAKAAPQTPPQGLNTYASNNQTYSNFSASPVATSLPSPPTPANSTRPSLHSQSSGSGPTIGASAQKIEPIYANPGSRTQTQSRHASNPSTPDGRSLPIPIPMQPHPTIQLLSQIGATSKQQYQNLLAQVSKSSTGPNVTQFLLGAMKKIQTHQAAQAQAQSTSTPNAATMQQVLAAYQQQQQQQSAQMLAALQQQQQQTPGFDASQFLAQYQQQQNQDVANMMAMMQSNTPAPGFDWSSLAGAGAGAGTGGAEVDPSMLLSDPSGGAGTDYWGSMTDMMAASSANADATSMGFDSMSAALF